MHCIIVLPLLMCIGMMRVVAICTSIKRKTAICDSHKPPPCYSSGQERSEDDIRATFTRHGATSFFIWKTQSTFKSSYEKRKYCAITRLCHLIITKPQTLQRSGVFKSRIIYTYFRRRPHCSLKSEVGQLCTGPAVFLYWKISVSFSDHQNLYSPSGNIH